MGWLIIAGELCAIVQDNLTQENYLKDHFLVYNIKVYLYFSLSRKLELIQKNQYHFLNQIQIKTDLVYVGQYNRMPFMFKYDLGISLIKALFVSSNYYHFFKELVLHSGINLANAKWPIIFGLSA